MDSKLLLVSPTLSFLFTDAIHYRNISRHSSITPPPDHEANIARARGLEAQARNDLLAAGCTPCYPVDLDFPVQNVSNKYDALAYYQSLGGTGLVPLRAQLSDWNGFCKYQSEVRRYYLQRKSFGTFEEKVRNRRRRHGYEGDASFDPNPEIQSQLQNWIEFQNYHLELYERLESDLQNKKKALEAARKKLEIGATEDADMGVEIFQGRVEVDETKIRQYKKLLRWIEQQRMTRVTKSTARIYAPRNGHRANSTTAPTFPRCRKRIKTSSSPLDPVRSAVSKQPSIKRKSWRLSKLGALQSQSARYATLNSKVPDPRRSKRIPELEAKASRHGKGRMPLRPFRPQKVSKAARTTTKANVPAAVKAKLQLTDWSNRSASEVKKTRSGRQTRRPKRLGFDPAR